MTTREQLTHERVDALLRMVAEDGATAEGELPPPEHVRAILSAREPAETRRVIEKHAKGRGPPEWAENSGNGGGK